MATDFLQSAFEMLSKPLTVESEQQLDLAIEQYDQDAREATYRYYPGSSESSDGASVEEVKIDLKDVAISPPVVGLGPPPMPAGATTELQQMLTAWYYAGYYAGLYAGKNIKDS